MVHRATEKVKGVRELNIEMIERRWGERRELGRETNCENKLRQPPSGETLEKKDSLLL